MACTSGKTKVSTAVNYGGDTTISAVHPDIIQTHILTRLNGPTLASAAATSTQFRALSSQEHLWANACYSTWPSTNSPRVRQVISTFQNGSRSFFSDSYTASRPSPTNYTNMERTPKLISAVDLFHGQNLIMSKVVETETETEWFRYSPFRVDLIDRKDAVQTTIKCPVTSDTFQDLGEEVTLSWIIIDPMGRRAVNVSSSKAVSLQRHWLSGGVQAQFATVVPGGEVGTASEVALCSAVVTWGGEMQVREVSLQIKDMDGMNLNGRESLVILQRALEGDREKVKDGKEEKDYREYVKRKEDRMEEKVKAEERLDMLCVMGFIAFLFVWFFCLLVSLRCWQN